MKQLGNLAVIGSGATTIFFLYHLEQNAALLGKYLKSVTLFEKSGFPGCGMPYRPETTDRFNMSNISSEEIPKLPETLIDWLRSRDEEELEKWGMRKSELSESEVYARLPLGQYLHAQYRTIVARLREKDIPVEEINRCEITDIAEEHNDSRSTYLLCDAEKKRGRFDSVIIATGHQWRDEDRPEVRYFASPWPISKLLPPEGAHHDFHVGTLGASLSAFDVVSSLAHRHGTFSTINGGELHYEPHHGTENFKLFMHSVTGWLPQLQFDQVEPFREIYRHCTRAELFSLRDDEGFLRLGIFFDKICRPALAKAFQKDGLNEIAEKLANPNFRFGDFVAKMSRRHDYENAFDGMRQEMIGARDSVLNHHPVHWKEIIDDLMYCLNFHAEMMPAEDHLTLRKTVMPFLLNVIAAMPLPSAKHLLALHEAGKLELVTGHVSVDEKQEKDDRIKVAIKNGAQKTSARYGMFVDCSGQKSLELEDYPFPTLVKTGKVRRAHAQFIDTARAEKEIADQKNERVFKDGDCFFLQTGGIEIDVSYRVIDRNGVAHEHLYDLAFPHTSGIRPYSYGLQACNATASIVVNSWLSTQ